MSCEKWKENMNNVPISLTYSSIQHETPRGPNWCCDCEWIVVLTKSQSSLNSQPKFSTLLYYAQSVLPHRNWDISVWFSFSMNNIWFGLTDIFFADLKFPVESQTRPHARLNEYWIMNIHIYTIKHICATWHLHSETNIRR